MEVGPFRTVPASQTESGQTELKLVEGGWEEYATMVFIDQPPGTGFSYVPTNGFLHELDEASAHLIHFMTNFYKVFPELEGQETYLAGESFAGQYIPYFGELRFRHSIDRSRRPTKNEEASQARAQGYRDRERVDRSPATVPRLPGVCVQEGAHRKGLSGEQQYTLLS